MTSSFVQILSRHKGPYRLLICFPISETATKKEREAKAAQWWPEKSKDPVEDAYAMLTKAGNAIRSINVWSESEEAFVLTILEEDRSTWDRERDGWLDATKVLRKANTPTVVVKMPAEGIPAETVARVLELRASGLGYVAIDSEFGIEGKKGWWSWKIVKVATAAAKEVR